MLYGHIIFIKKAGGDGSKYPVSEKNVKIGRSEECLIRIYNTQVALEHCQLIIGENGQATLKDLSNQTFLNGNILAHEEATLCHGDVFKVGERLARWEYLPTSKYYRQLLSPTGRLVAVVIPQQRCLEDQPSGTSASFDSTLKNTLVGGKKRYSERFASESPSAVKRRKSSNSSLVKNSKGDLSKMLTGRYSLKNNKLILPVAKIKDLRKSISGINSSRTPKGKSRKSALPSWKINSVSPATIIAEIETALSPKSIGKSAKSYDNGDKILLNHASDPESEKVSVARKKFQSPQNTTLTLSEEIVKSTSKNVFKTSKEAAAGSPLKIGRIRKSVQSLSNSPSPKKPTLVSTPSIKPVRLFHSEKKPNCNVRKSSVRLRQLKRLNEVLIRANKSRGNQESNGSLSYEELKILDGAKEVSDLNARLKPNKSNAEFPDRKKETSIKMKTEKFDKTLNKNLVNKDLDSSGDEVKTPRVNETEKVKEELTKEKLKTSVPVHVFQASPFNESGVGKDYKKRRQVLHFQNKAISAKSTPSKKTPKKSGKSAGKVTPLSSRKNLSKSLLLFSRTSAANSASARSPKSSSVRISLRKTINLSKERISSPRGVRRKLSPSISSAERAAKELKTSSPKKPDKNKKAALLVLGKANRKQLLAQNVKVLLKQKIVKKAIKQSTTANIEKINNDKKKSFASVKGRPKKGLQKNTSKTKKKEEKNISSKRNASANSSKSVEVPFQSKNETGYISKGENALEENLINASKVSETWPRSPSKLNKNLFSEAPEKSPSNQYMKSESHRSIHSRETSSPFGNLEKMADNFLFNSNRRCSKRLSSKNDLGRPDFVELSPTALGLIPKNVEVFKTPKSNKRKSSSLVTPKMVHSVGIIKSASTSKIGSRKNVRFSSKDLSISSEFNTPGEKSDIDFGAYQTPDVSVDAFISPLGDKTTDSKMGLNESSRIRFASGNNFDGGSSSRSNSEPRKCIRKLLQSPQTNRRVSSNEFQRCRRSSANKDRKQTIDPENSEGSFSHFISEVCITPQNNSSDNNVKRVNKLPKTPRIQKNLKNDLSDLRGVKKLLTTPKVQKSPKNDLSDVRGVRKLLRTPKAQRSPKNDLSDVRGVKKLLRTPRAQKSPKNDLSDVRGVKKLLATPKVQKSPKNDLSDVRGVKQLLRTPKAQKSPKNDLSDVRGVKQLLRTPKAQKSPKNDLSDLRGVRKLLATPKVQKSPKNDLSDVRGVKKLLSTPKAQKSPKNVLSDLRGVQKLLRTPKAQKSPKNDLSDLRGVRKLLATPKVQKSPKNDLSDVRGVKELLGTPKAQKSPKNELLELSGIQQLFGTPKLHRSSRSNSADAKKKNLSEFLVENVIKSPGNQKLSKDSAKHSTGLSQSFQLGEHEIDNVLNIDDVKKVPESGRSRKSVSRKSNAGEKVKGGRSTSKETKNDLSDVTGVRELFARNEPKSDLNESLKGVSQLLSTPEEEAVSTLKGRTRGRKSTTGGPQKVPKRASPDKETKGKDESIKTRRNTRNALKTALAEENTKKSVRDKKSKTDLKTESTERMQTKRKTAVRAKSSEAKKSPIVKRSERIKKGTKKSGGTSQARTKPEPKEIKTRKRKAAMENTASPPPKQRRKRAAESIEKPKTASVSSEKVKTIRKAGAKAKDEKAKSKVSKVQNKTFTTNKIQKKRSQSSTKKKLSGSQESFSPIKTRSVKREAASQQNHVGKRRTTAENKVSGRKKMTPVVKKSTRRK